MINKLERRLDDWKAKSSTLGGRLILLNSVLLAIFNLFSLYFHYFKMGKRKMNICKRFLCRSMNNTRIHYHLVSWVQVYRPKCEGSLGVIELRSFNLALLCKWWWKILSNPKGTLQGILIANYDDRKGLWRTSMLNRVRASSLFKDIMKTSLVFWSSIDFHVGTNSRVAFWLDRWCSGISLAVTFPKTYDLAFDKEDTVHDYLAPPMMDACIEKKICSWWKPWT